jgi:hypothetical protein
VTSRPSCPVDRRFASAAMIRRRGIWFVVVVSGSFVVFAAPDGLR